MKIPIQNIYYLLCYAWDKLEEKEVVDVTTRDYTHLVDLFAKVLINGSIYLFKKGLDRDYREREEETRRLRGKILFGPSLKRNLFMKSQVCCKYDELSHDILHNRILKATMAKLIRFNELNKDLKEEVVKLYKRFPQVSDIEIKTQHFNLVRLHRNNYFYDFLLRICKIIHESVLIDEKSGMSRFMDFIRDEGKMSYVFEEFVRNFMKKEQNIFRVKRDGIVWDIQKSGDYDHFLPGMETDTSLIAKDRSKKIVIETKYYKSIFQARPGGQEKLISSNLYQLYAYMKNLEARGYPDANCEGILLYATVDKDVDLSFSLPNHFLRVRTINLNQSWQGIHEDLLGLVGLS